MSGESAAPPPIVFAIMDIVQASAPPAPPKPKPTSTSNTRRVAVLTLSVHHPPQETGKELDLVKAYKNSSEHHTIGISANDGLTDKEIGRKIAELRGLFSMLEQSVDIHKKECANWVPWSTQPNNNSLISITLMDLRGRLTPDDTDNVDSVPTQLKSCNYAWIQVANDVVNQFQVMKDAWEEQNLLILILKFSERILLSLLNKNVRM